MAPDQLEKLLWIGAVAFLFLVGGFIHGGRGVR